MQISQIKAAIAKWGEINDTVLGLDFLTSGIGFTITREEYKEWESLESSYNEEINSIHLYLGIWGTKFIFFLVDSLSDQRSEYESGKNLFVKDFCPSISTDSEAVFPSVPTVELSENDAMKRFLRWALYSTDWFKKNQTKFPTDSPQGILKGMIIPFSDLKQIFNVNTRIDSLFCFFGIREDNQYGNVIELILCEQLASNETNKLFTPKLFMDVTKPVPPFSPTGFNLF